MHEDIKSSTSELQLFLKSANDSLKKELVYRDRYFAKGALYREELEHIEENIRNYKEFIRLIENELKLRGL